MLEKIKIIRIIKKLRQSPVDDAFLQLLRSRLEVYVSSNPVIGSEKERLYLSGERSVLSGLILKFKIMPIPLIIALIAALSGGGVTMASQSSLPGETLYPVKILTEEVREAVTLNQEAKVVLETKFAAKRIAEIKEVFAKDGAESKGLDIALSRFEKHIARANAIIEKKKQKGEDVEDLNEKIDSVKEERNTEIKVEAENAIKEAQEARQEMAAPEEGEAVISEDAFTKYNDFIAKAEAALAGGHYVQARQHAKQAEDALEHAQKAAEKAIEKADKENRQAEKVKNTEKAKNATSTQEKQEAEDAEEVEDSEDVEETD